MGLMIFSVFKNRKVASLFVYGNNVFPMINGNMTTGETWFKDGFLRWKSPREALHANC